MIPAIVGFEQGQQPFSQAQIDRAIRAAGTDDPDMVRQILAEDLAPQEKVTSNFSLMDALIPTAQAATMMPVTSQTDVEMLQDDPSLARKTPKEVFDERVTALREKTGGEERQSRNIFDMIKSIIPDDLSLPEAKGYAKPNPALVAGQRGNFSQGLQDDPSIVEKDIPGIRRGNIVTDDKRVVKKDDLPKLRTTDTEAAPAGKSVATGGADATDATKGTTTGQKTTDLVKQLQDALGKDQKATGLEGEIQALQSKLEKDRETDKYLALAQAGLALMSSKNPRLLGAIGEAGISGLKAMREAQDRYSEGVIDLINARAKLRKAADTNVLSKDVLLREAINLETDAAKPENFASKDSLLSRAAQLRGLAGLPPIKVASTS